MVIYIDKSICEHLETNRFSQEELLFFSDLASAHLRAQCFLCGDLKSIERLATVFSAPYSAAYTSVVTHHAETQAIIETVDVVAVISYDQTPTLPSFLANKAIIISARVAAQENIHIQCSLVCEHLEDCAFYIFLGQRFCCDHGISGVGISFAKELGGGGSIGAVMKKCVSEDKKITLGICDADIRFGKPKNDSNDVPRGSTYQAFISAVRQLERAAIVPPFAYCCPNIHEVENLIPTKIIESIAEEHSDIRPGLTTLKKIGSVRDGEPALYYDIKNGIDKQSLIKKDNARALAYWTEIECEANANCCHSLGKNLLQQSIAKLEERDYYKLVEIDDYLKKWWADIGFVVYSWGCCSNGIRV